MKYYHRLGYFQLHLSTVTPHYILQWYKYKKWPLQLQIKLYRFLVHIPIKIITVHAAFSQYVKRGTHNTSVKNAVEDVYLVGDTSDSSACAISGHQDVGYRYGEWIPVFDQSKEVFGLYTS